MTSRSLTVAAVLVALIGLLGTHRSAMAKELYNAADLEHAVLEVQDIRVILDLSRCTEQGTGKFGPEIRGNIHPDGCIVQGDHGIAFAETNFTVRPPYLALGLGLGLVAGLVTYLASEEPLAPTYASTAASAPDRGLLSGKDLRRLLGLTAREAHAGVRARLSP